MKMKLPRPSSAAAFRTADGGTEPYVINPRTRKATSRKKKKNPPVIIVNPPKRGKKMARTIQMKRNRFGQFVAKGRGGTTTKRKSNPPRKRRAAPRKKPAKRGARRNVPTNWEAGLVNNNNRRKRNPPRRVMGFDRQGQIFGIPTPAVSDVLYLSLGLGGPPIIKGITLRFIPTTFGTGQGAMFGVEALSYAIPVGIGFAIGGPRAVRGIIAGEAAGLLVRVVSRYTQLGRTPRIGRPGVSGYLGPVPSRSLGAYTKPVSQSMLRGLPRGPGAPSPNRTRRASRYG